MKRMRGLLKAFREPVNGLTHLAGALLSVVGLGLLLARAAAGGNVWQVASFAVFGVSLVLLYTASSLYHLVRLSPRGVRTLRRIDHMAVYVLIAGTYTPFCLVALRQRAAWGWSLLGIVWGLALAGIVLKTVWLGAPRRLTTLFYAGMGWMVVVAIVPLVRSVPAAGLAWLAAGGLFYTVGAAIYAFKWPNPRPNVFGFHEIWHLFVMAGSFSHFWAIYQHLSRLA
jgi:hemolysin III